MDFFTESELSTQIGYYKRFWPYALLRELIDNALDACEQAGVAPDIRVELGADTLTLQDNGPGIPLSTLKGSLNYLVKVSDKSYYVSPTRGRLGNALKTVWAAPFVAVGEQGWVEITTGGVTHQVKVHMDRIAQEPILVHTHAPTRPPFVQTGTRITLHWPGIAGLSGKTRSGGFVQ
jgi:DNA topoisomerase-6 subunit B